MSENAGSGRRVSHSLMGLEAVAKSVTVPQTAFPGSARAPDSAREVGHVIDDLDLAEFTSVAAAYGHARYGYVVTPNVDHIIRCHEDAGFRALYRSAEFVLMDSRFFARILRMLTGVRLRVCTGADLSEALLSKVAAADDPIVIVGGEDGDIAKLALRYRLTHVHHYNPPMGFIDDPLAVEQCLQFIESESPFRFCFLAIGSPQQEVLAHHLKSRGVARGLALCVGASLNFLTGVERRAPRWMQQLSLEWLHRLLENPQRMAGRYLIRGPRIFRYLRRARFTQRKATLTRA